MSTATLLGIPVLAFASSLSYYDALRAERLPAALTQGQRDFFGAHIYERDGLALFRCVAHENAARTSPSTTIPPPRVRPTYRPPSTIRHSPRNSNSTTTPPSAAAWNSTISSATAPYRTPCETC